MQKSKKQCLLILGNGFDIFRGYKTKYSDFIQATYSEETENIWGLYFLKIEQEKGWVALESEFKNIIDSFQEFHELHNREQLLVIEPTTISSESFRLRNFYKFIDISSNIVTPKLNTFEFRISMAALNNKAYIYHNQENETILCMKTLKNKMKLDFLELKKDLELYLMNTFKVQYKIADVEKFKSYFSQFSQVTVLNFNYNKHINHYINKPDNWNVHGVIKDDRKPIILGHNKIENLEFCEFNKEIDIWDKSQIRKGNGEDVVITVLGHSLDENDWPNIIAQYRNLIAPNSVKEGLSRIDIFYHDQESKRKNKIMIERLVETIQPGKFSELQYLGKVQAMDINDFKIQRNEL